MNIESDGGSAEVYLSGAHVTAFQPRDEDPVLWMSKKSAFVEGKAIRGGVPICFPWFGAHPGDATLPSHGLVRQRPWSVESVAKLANGAVEATLSISSDSDTLKVWPHEFRLVFSVVVSDMLSVTLEVHNPGPNSIAVTDALHSYFAVSDVRSVELHGLDGFQYIGKLRESEGPIIQRGPIRFVSETDRPYLSTTDSCTINDTGMNRSIVIHKRGSLSTVVWNPWIYKAKRMPDFGDEEWMGMLCVETANVLRNEISIPAGASHSMEAIISVNRLGA